MKLCHQISFLAVLFFFFSISEAARSTSSKHGLLSIILGSGGHHGGKIFKFRAEIFHKVSVYGVVAPAGRLIFLKQFLNKNTLTLLIILLVESLQIKLHM